MKTNTKETPKKQSVSDLPLLDWRVAVHHPTTTAGCFLVRQFGVAPCLADTIAALAGLGREAR